MQELGSANPMQLAVSPSLSVGVDLLTSLFDDQDPAIRLVVGRRQVESTS